MYFGIITVMLSLNIAATMVQKVLVIGYSVYTPLTLRVAVSPNS